LDRPTGRKPNRSPSRPYFAPMVSPGGLARGNKALLGGRRRQRESRIRPPAPFLHGVDGAKRRHLAVTTQTSGCRGKNPRTAFGPDSPIIGGGICWRGDNESRLAGRLNWKARKKNNQISGAHTIMKLGWRQGKSAERTAVPQSLGATHRPPLQERQGKNSAPSTSISTRINKDGVPPAPPLSGANGQTKPKNKPCTPSTGNGFRIQTHRMCLLFDGSGAATMNSLSLVYFFPEVCEVRKSALNFETKEETNSTTSRRIFSWPDSSLVSSFFGRRSSFYSRVFDSFKPLISKTLLLD